MAAQTLRCEHCGGRFTKQNSRGPAPKYCSNAHRQAAFVARTAANTRAELARLRKEVARLRKIERLYDLEHADDRYDPMG